MVTAYKFLDLKDGKIKSRFGTKTWKVGRKYSVKGVVQRCSHGFHASPEPLDALGYVKGDVLALVEPSGDSDNESDKVCYRSMRIVNAYHWTKRDSVELAIYAAELVIDVFEQQHPSDDRPRKAIEAAHAWVANPSKDAAYAAANAAYAANAADAAYAAANAAYAAANAAYAAAAANAAYAADAAAYAAYAEIKAKINEWIKDRINTLEPVA